MRVATPYAALSRGEHIAFGDLAPEAQRLITPADYDALDKRRKITLQVITHRMLDLGVDYSGVSLRGGVQGIQVDRLFFAPNDLGAFNTSVRAAVSDGRFMVDMPLPRYHAGMAEWGARQAVVRESMQVGMGPAGAFVDIDHWNPHMGKRAILGHVLEVAGNTLIPQKKTNLARVAAHLARDSR